MRITGIDVFQVVRQRVADHRERGYAAHSVKIGDDPALNAARIDASLADRRPGSSSSSTPTAA